MDKLSKAMPLENDSKTEALAAALNLGERLLICGGEPYRVEDTIRRICEAYGAERVGVFTITSTILVTAYFPGQGSITSSRRVARGISNDYEMLSRLNELSRKACNEPMTAAELQSRLDELEEGCPHYPLWFIMATWAVIAGAFCVFFGGSYADCIVSAIIGAVLKLFSVLFSEKLDIPPFFSTIALSLIGGLLSRLFVTAGFEINIYVVNVGVVMLLIPGIILTNSIRDLALGDFISGLLRFMEALLLSIAIAWAFAVTAGVIPETVVVAPIASLISAVIGSTAFCLMFNVRGKQIPACSLGGLIAWGMVLLCTALGLSEYWGYFLSSLTFGIYAQVMARALKTPVSIFTACASLPLIPGASLYRTMFYAVSYRWNLFAITGIHTICYAVLISAGILVVLVFMRSRAYVKSNKIPEEK